MRQRTDRIIRTVLVVALSIAGCRGLDSADHEPSIEELTVLATQAGLPVLTLPTDPDRALDTAAELAAAFPGPTFPAEMFAESAPSSETWAALFAGQAEAEQLAHDVNGTDLNSTDLNSTAEPGRADPPTTVEWRDHTLVVTAAAPGTLRLTENPGAPYDGPRIHCTWFELVIGGEDLEILRIADPVVGDTYVYSCWFTEPWVDPYPGYPIVAVFDPVVDPPGPVITTPEVARFAIDHIPFESPHAVTSPAGTHVVGVPSWFAIDSALDYPTISAQAGPVWASARPEFRDVRWHMGNGDILVCTSDATLQWQPNGPAEQSSDCTYVYPSTGRSPDETLPAETLPAETLPAAAVVTWTIWQRTDRTNGAWEVWGDVSLTTVVPLVVTELQAAID